MVCAVRAVREEGICGAFAYKCNALACELQAPLDALDATCQSIEADADLRRSFLALREVTAQAGDRPLDVSQARDDFSVALAGRRQLRLNPLQVLEDQVVRLGHPAGLDRSGEVLITRCAGLAGWRQVRPGFCRCRGSGAVLLCHGHTPSEATPYWRSCSNTSITIAKTRSFRLVVGRVVARRIKRRSRALLAPRQLDRDSATCSPMASDAVSPGDSMP